MTNGPAILAASERVNIPTPALTIGTTILGVVVVNLALAMTTLRGSIPGDTAAYLLAGLNTVQSGHILHRLWSLASPSYS